MTTFLISLSIINLISVTVGTFIANFGLMWLIGNRAKKMEEQQARFLRDLQKQAVQKYNAEVKKRREYLEMES